MTTKIDGIFLSHLLPSAVLTSLSLSSLLVDRFQAKVTMEGWEELPLELPEGLAAGAPKLVRMKFNRSYKGDLEGKGTRLFSSSIYAPLTLISSFVHSVLRDTTHPPRRTVHRCWVLQQQLSQQRRR